MKKSIILAAVALLAWAWAHGEFEAEAAHPDHKMELGMYADAKGPPWANVAQVGVTRMPWGRCMKPATAIGQDAKGNNIYPEDTDVIWRCVQTHPTGAPIPTQEAPLVYCFMPPVQDREPATKWICYHDYSVVWQFYRAEWSKNPIVAEDELPYIPEAK